MAPRTNAQLLKLTKPLIMRGGPPEIVLGLSMVQRMTVPRHQCDQCSHTIDGYPTRQSVGFLQDRADSLFRFQDEPTKAIAQEVKKGGYGYELHQGIFVVPGVLIRIDRDTYEKTLYYIEAPLTSALMWRKWFCAGSYKPPNSLQKLFFRAIYNPWRRKGVFEVVIAYTDKEARSMPVLLDRYDQHQLTTNEDASIALIRAFKKKFEQ
jgi:hypothetical protein